MTIRTYAPLPSTKRTSLGYEFSLTQATGVAADTVFVRALRKNGRDKLCEFLARFNRVYVFSEPVFLVVDPLGSLAPRTWEVTFTETPGTHIRP